MDTTDEELKKRRERYNRINTVKDIGIHLTNRMIRAMSETGADNDIAYNSPPSIAGPADGTLYKESDDAPNAHLAKNLQNYKSFTSSYDNQPLKYRYGDNGIVSNVNYDSPGIAMGEANVLNPDFQFNELDDIRSDFRRPYIGRLYSERIYDYNLPIVLFQTGLVTLNVGFFGALEALTSNGPGATHDMASYLRDPGVNPIKFMFQKIGGAIRSVLNFTVGGLLAGARFYEFKENTHIYMRFVNEMLIEVAAWMNLAGLPTLDLYKDYDEKLGKTKEDADEIERKLAESIENPTSTGDPDIDGEFDEVEGGKQAFTKSKGYVGLPESLSVLNILPGWKTKNYVSRNTSNVKFFDKLAEVGEETLNMTAAKFIPFGLSKGVNISESFGNETMTHPLSEELKSRGNKVYQQSAIGFLGLESTATDVISKLSDQNYTEAIISVGQEVLKQTVTAMGKAGVFGESGMILTGEGKFQLPDIWEDSTYTRNYNLSFEFRSPYGSRLSIFENTMMQTIFLICMTAPRQVGTATYMSPFYIKAFSKGLFSVEIGLIKNLSIKKAEEKNERTIQGFSKSISCDVEIKDVIPRLMVGIDAGVFGILSSKNIGFREYISMLANVDLIDRIAFGNKFKAFVNVLTNRFSKDNIMNELMYSISQTLPFKLILKARINFRGYHPPQTVSSIRPQSSYS